MWHTAYNDTFWHISDTFWHVDFVVCKAAHMLLLLILLVKKLPCTQAGGVEALSADPHALKEAMVYACAAGGLTCTRKVRDIVRTAHHSIDA